MGIQIKRIEHVGILVSDFERSFKFYTEILGVKSPAVGKEEMAVKRLSSALRTRTTTW